MRLFQAHSWCQPSRTEKHWSPSASLCLKTINNEQRFVLLPGSLDFIRRRNSFVRTAAPPELQVKEQNLGGSIAQPIPWEGPS